VLEQLEILLNMRCRAAIDAGLTMLLKSIRVYWILIQCSKGGKPSKHHHEVRINYHVAMVGKGAINPESTATR
jgi:hypothetical protein